MAGKVAAGFGLGLLVLPLTLLVTRFFGGGMLVQPVVCAAFTAGAISLPPTSGARVAGVLAGIAGSVLLVFGFFALLLSMGPIG